MPFIDAATPNGFGLMADLDILDPDKAHRFISIIERKPLSWSELADIGHRSPLGVQFKNDWTDYRTPPGFLGIRQFVGAELLMETAAAHGFKPAGEPITPYLQAKAPFKHIRYDLVTQLVETSAIAPWPGLKAPYPSMVVMIPRGACVADVHGTAPDAVAAVTIQCRDGEGGLELRWNAWGWDGGAWGDGWGVKPLLEFPISRLVWGIVGLLNTSIDAPAPSVESAGTGFIRSKRLRPDPSWIEPRRHIERRPRHGEPSGEHRSPHWRQAHPHRFWKGSRKGKQTLVTHWLPAIWVDPEVDDND